MTDGILTADQILAAAQEVLRRYGPAKATVVDVARALGVSHGSVYRHFPSKTALREAVTQRWLDESHAGLAAVMAMDTPADVRLRDWLSALAAAKRKKALDDPELFATYSVLVQEASTVIDRHVAGLIAQIEQIIAAGVARGELVAPDPAVAARAVLQATSTFHNPVHAAGWGRPGIDDDFTALCDLILLGLKPR
ncbi:DNA-binding transcriptional regulator, AcrR family [Nonomuraea solani]|uniref:DNA-binding transcriptional regulator, AcrR family n=1 Tax=Nonomuraea solani TaxID=1144553 RepID=A0A1H6EVI2_9ACTN|nr:TetR family transcriptional regulator [Nonomuraea solani]SEH01897.1 DNA-binding transcriptional regulator, AcrR family [Nonomuraea solani]